MWKFFFLFVRLDTFIWRIFAKPFFKRPLNVKSFKFYKLPYHDRYLLAMFHTQYNYIFNDFIADDRYKIFKYRFYEHTLLYFFMSYYSVYRSNYLNNQSIVKIAFLIKLTHSSFYLSPYGLRYRWERFSDFFGLNVIVYKYYYRYYTYYILNMRNINGWAPRYQEADNLFFLFLNILSLNDFDEPELFNVNKFYDFFDYLHEEGDNIIIYPRLYKKPNNWLRNRLLLLKQQTYFRYHMLYMTWFITEFTFKEHIISLPLSIPNNVRFFFKVSEKWVLKMKQKFPIKFSVSNITSFIKYKSLKRFIIYYIRKNRIFNKGRYSRNRQQYRTGFYWCLWLNVMVVYGLYFFFIVLLLLLVILVEVWFY